MRCLGTNLLLQPRTLTRLLRRLRPILTPLRDQRGVGLVELMFAMASLLVVIGAAMGLMVVALHREPVVTQRADRVDQARTTLERMTRELRQTYLVQTVGSNELSFYTYERVAGASTASQRFVSYQCQTGQCIRREAPVGQALPDTGQVVVDGVDNSDLFTFSPNTITPEFVAINFRLTIPGQTRTITVQDGVNLRNATNYAD
jgi:hypothetical protein